MKDICRLVDEDDGVLHPLMHDVETACGGEEGRKAWAAEIMETASVRDSFPVIVNILVVVCRVVLGV